METPKDMNSPDNAFLLQEHHETWEYLRQNIEVEHSWMKFYYVIVAASFAALGYLYKILILEPKPPNPEKFWLIATFLLLCLGIVSFIVVRVFLVIRIRAGECRNNLNIIRAWFLDKEESNFENYLGQNQDEPKNNSGKNLEWKYWPRSPLKKFTVTWVIKALIAIASLTWVSLLSSAFHVVCPSYRIHNCFCVSAFVHILGFIIICFLSHWFFCRELQKAWKKFGKSD